MELLSEISNVAIVLFLLGLSAAFYGIHHFKQGGQLVGKSSFSMTRLTSPDDCEMHGVNNSGMPGNSWNDVNEH